MNRRKIRKLGNADKNVKISEKSWAAKDDEGRDVYSLLAPPVAVALIKQLADILI